MNGQLRPAAALFLVHNRRDRLGLKFGLDTTVSKKAPAHPATKTNTRLFSVHHYKFQGRRSFICKEHFFVPSV